MKADTDIAGHGFTEQDPVSNEEIRAYHKALAAVIAQATRLHRAGMPVEDAVRQADWGAYASWTLATTHGPIAVRKVYEELNGWLNQVRPSQTRPTMTIVPPPAILAAASMMTTASA
jgi:hypothetical protein